MRYWINTISKDHVIVGRQAGFIQANHGKAAPLARLEMGNLMVFYSPKEIYGETVSCQRFTALAEISGEKSYQVTVSDSFKPFRKAARYLDVKEVPIHPLLGSLGFIPDRSHWGLPFRRGLFEVNRADFRRIALAMGLERLVA